MDFQISLRIAAPPATRTLDDVPVYPMGVDVRLEVELTNMGAEPLVLDQPETSQYTALHMAGTDESPANVFFLNPSFEDATGERTAPPYHEVSMAPGQSARFSISLHKYALESVFEPGRYRFEVTYKEQRSNSVEFGVEYQAASVPSLFPYALETAGSRSLQGQAMGWLDRLPLPPGLTPRDRRESDEAKAARLAKNQERATQFLANWETAQQREDMRAFFESVQLK